jgi:hypothetical protein
MAFSVTHLPGHAWSVSPLVESRVGVVAASVPELGGNVNFEIAASLSGPYSEKEVADFLVKERLKRGADFVSYENYLLGTFLDYLPQGLTKAFDNARDIFNDEDPSMADLADKFIEASSTDFRPVLLSNVVGIKVSIPSGPCDEVIDAGEVEFCNESENEW